MEKVAPQSGNVPYSEDMISVERQDNEVDRGVSVTDDMEHISA